MIELQKEDFDRVIRSGSDLIIYFYQKGDANNVLVESAIQEVDGLIGKNYSVYQVDVDMQPEICRACSISQWPEIISVKNSKIHKRINGTAYANQVLDLLK